jgi:cell division GTPase FtsZ
LLRTIINVIASPALINLDFGDIRSIMAEMGTLMLGTGEAEGEGKYVSSNKHIEKRNNLSIFL